MWRIDDLRWLPVSAYRPPSVEIAVEDEQTRFAGLVKTTQKRVLKW